MLETSEDRIKLLKTGFTHKKIEEMYIEGNDFKIVSLPGQFDLIEIEEEEQKRTTCEISVVSAHSIGLAVAGIFNVSQFERLSISQ